MSGFDVVGLHVHASERRPVLALVEQTCHRRCEAALDRHEAEPLVQAAGRRVVLEHIELQHGRPLLVRELGRRAHQLETVAFTPRFGPDVQHIDNEVLRPLAPQREEPVLVGEKRDVRREVVFVVVAPRRVRNLDIEGVPELLDERSVGVGGDADHGVRCASRR